MPTNPVKTIFDDLTKWGAGIVQANDQQRSAGVHQSIREMGRPDDENNIRNSKI
jgi:hypothetical protein